MGCDTNKKVCGDGRDARRQEKSRPDGKTNNRDNRNDKKSGPDGKRNNRNDEKGEGDHDDRRFLTSPPPPPEREMRNGETGGTGRSQTTNRGYAPTVAAEH